VTVAYAMVVLLVLGIVALGVAALVPLVKLFAAPVAAPVSVKVTER
jgi:hypothetical protein